jgi:hypothetical protein
MKRLKKKQRKSALSFICMLSRVISIVLGTISFQFIADLKL